MHRYFTRVQTDVGAMSYALLHASPSFRLTRRGLPCWTPLTSLAPGARYFVAKTS